MKSLLCIATLVGIFGISDGMNLEQSFYDKKQVTEVHWVTIIKKTQEATENHKLHVIDVESVYGGGETYNPQIVCEQALAGDSVAQYSLYRHIKRNDYDAYMFLAISAIFGKFPDSIEEAANLGLNLKASETHQTLHEKISIITDKYEY